MRGEEGENIAENIPTLLAVLKICNDRKKAVPSWFLLLLEVVIPNVAVTVFFNWRQQIGKIAPQSRTRGGV